MSDWLEQLSELEQRAKMLQGQASRIYEHPDDHDTDTYCLARDVDTFVDDMQPVIDRARRAEELERENEKLRVVNDNQEAMLKHWALNQQVLQGNMTTEQMHAELAAAHPEQYGDLA